MSAAYKQVARIRKGLGASWVGHSAIAPVPPHLQPFERQRCDRPLIAASKEGHVRRQFKDFVASNEVPAGPDCIQMVRWVVSCLHCLALLLFTMKMTFARLHKNNRDAQVLLGKAIDGLTWSSKIIPSSSGPRAGASCRCKQ